MPGGLLYSFRQGNRSEYLAQYFLSALGLSVAVPHQEDIGADFYCALASRNERRLTFHSPFIIQVKSTNSSEADLSYGGPDSRDGSRHKKEEIDWLFSQELPLLVGLTNRTAKRLDIYCTSNMWQTFYKSGNPAQVVLQPGNPPGATDLTPPEDGQVTSSWQSAIGDGKKWTIHLGPPLVSMCMDDVENEERLNLYRQIIGRAVELEQQNISYRRLGVHFSRWPLRIQTNVLEPVFVFGIGWVGNTKPGANVTDQLKQLAPFISTLAFNFRLQGNHNGLSSLKPIVQLIPIDQISFLERDFPELFH